MSAENPFAGWEVFNLIVGATSGALIGLQFVASAIAADNDSGDEPATNSATVAHFSAALTVCSLCGVPWHSEVIPQALWTVAGSSGMLYMIHVAKRLFHPRVIRPTAEDIAFHLVYPLIAYMALFVAGLVSLETGLFFSSFCALALMLVGIHNAYDAVMFQVFLRRRSRR